MTKRFAAATVLRQSRRVAATFLWRLRQGLPSFTGDRRANVAITFAITAIPVLFAIGGAIDYTMANVRKAKLDAIADTIALSTVTQSGTPPAFSPIPGKGLNATAAQARAQTLFNALAGTVSGVSNFKGTVTVVDSTTSNTSPRSTTVKYTAQSNDAFARIIGMNTIGIGNSSNPAVAQVAIAPNINFYILADSSPSMAIPATSSGISQMYTATSSGTGGGGDNENGCAFACHESDYTRWVLPGNSSCVGVVAKTNTVKSGKTSQTITYYTAGTSKNPGYVDDYTYAECVLGLTLRIDNLRSAIQQLGPYALNVASQNGANYSMSVATFDTDWSTSSCTAGNSPLHYISGGSSLTPQNMSTASSAAASIQMLQMFNNGYLTGTNQTSSTTPNQYKQICSNDDGSTALNTAMTKINTLMPTPGNGTNASGDTPQEVLMLITDGVNDTYSPRTISTIDATTCNAIKKRVSASGLPIRIAVLYLDYSPLPGNSFYNANVQPIDDNTVPAPNPNIATALQSCASSSSLFAKVTTDQDIGAALQQLFITATTTVHLAQ
ncbi:MAG TPA: TadE/TadG family type IV pilus assembly protein [Methylovirgula sp.]|nr:TadE/TadG family type IV pilus assembly protein [Methylovirgula sp.]